QRQGHALGEPRLSLIADARCVGVRARPRAPHPRALPWGRPPMPNTPLVSDRNVEFLLYEVFDVEALCHLNEYEEHSRETFGLVLQNARKFAREVLFPTYKPMDEAP